MEPSVSQNTTVSPHVQALERYLDYLRSKGVSPKEEDGEISAAQILHSPSRKAFILGADRAAFFLALRDKTVTKDMMLEAGARLRGYANWATISAILPRNQPAQQLAMGQYGGAHPLAGLVYANQVEKPFSLQFSQTRGGTDKMSHNASWYNAAGEMIGWGDLSAKDYVAIALVLQPRELFLAVRESDTPRSMLDRHSPGSDFLVEHAHFLVQPGRICRLWGMALEPATVVEHHFVTPENMPVWDISREEATSIVQAVQPKKRSGKNPMP